MSASYLPRIVEKEIASALSSMGAVVLEGPRACGKTSTARRFARSEALLDTDENLRAAAQIDPGLVLEGDAPRLLDEWQTVPRLWNHVRRAVDDRGTPGQFLLTGSAMPADDLTRHSGAGRFVRLRMRPMSLFEGGISTGSVSLRALLDGEPPRVADPGTGLRDLVEAVVRGGWPSHLNMDVAAAAGAARAYIDETRRVDVSRVDGRERDPDRVGRFLRSVARNVATYVDVSTMAADAGGTDGPLHWETAREYLRALERVLVLEDQPAWGPHIRSRARLRNSPKRHFVDPSLAVAALGVGVQDLLGDLEYFGLLFESLAVRDLRIYGQTLDADVLQYRDSNGLEVDAIVRARDGRWGAFEVKLGPHRIEEGAASLLRFSQHLDLTRVGKPGVLAVLTATGYGYRRDDGIAVVPIGALGP